MKYMSVLSVVLNDTHVTFHVLLCMQHYPYLYLVVVVGFVEIVQSPMMGLAEVVQSWIGLAEVLQFVTDLY